MFPCHFKIPGHSGTDFKHRKAFQKLNKRLKKLKRTNASLRNPVQKSTIKKSPSFSKTGVNLPIKWMVALLRLSMFGVIFILAKNIAFSLYFDLSQNEKKQTMLKEKVKKDFVMSSSTWGNPRRKSIPGLSSLNFLLKMRISPPETLKLPFRASSPPVNPITILL